MEDGTGVHIVFEAVRGMGLAGDIAIDDVQIKYDGCLTECKQ